MKSKHLVTAFSVCALLFTTVTFSNANVFTHGSSYDGGGYDLSSEKRTALEGIYDASNKKIQPLRDALYTKRLELDALAQNPNTSPETVSKLVKEITSLRTEIRKICEAFDVRIEKETGIRSSLQDHNDHDTYMSHGRHGGRHGGHGGRG